MIKNSTLNRHSKANKVYEPWLWRLNSCFVFLIIVALGKEQKNRFLRSGSSKRTLKSGLAGLEK